MIQVLRLKLFVEFFPISSHFHLLKQYFLADATANDIVGAQELLKHRQMLAVLLKQGCQIFI